MTSIITNTAALSALQTLRSVGSDLNDAQAHISSGKRILQASDDAAYWSISTTMRSDSKAVSAVSDALGLSSAMIDTAYTATNAIVDVLGEFKAKLVAAAEPGVDKEKVQKELNQLNDQVESIANSASFNGINFLKSSYEDSLDTLPDLREELVSSFSRSKSGSVSTDTIAVDLKRTTMINQGGGGILQRDPPPVFTELPATVENNYRVPGHETHTMAGPVTFAAGDTVSFDMIVDRSPEEATGRVTNITIDYADVVAVTGSGTISHVNQWHSILDTALTAADARASVTQSSWPTTLLFPASYRITTDETSMLVGSSVAIENVTGTQANALGLTGSYADEDNLFESATVQFNGPFSLAGGIELNFSFKINSDETVQVNINEDQVNSTLNVTDGTITTAQDLADVIQASIDDINMADQGLEIIVNGSELFFTPNQDFYPGYGGKAATFAMSSIVSNQAWSLQYDLADIDITTSQYSIEDYITGVDHMEKDVINSAADLGALKSRIDMQNDFAMDLIDTFDSGIGKLVDADMDWESTRLKALQTQEQLAIQSLSIANSNGQNLLQLFS